MKRMKDPYRTQITFFIKESDRHWDAAQSLYKTKHYDWALFVAHLSLEKLLKALIVKKMQQAAPFMHNLQDLARRANVELTNEQIKNLGEITTFNIEARYDTIRLDFYKRCTKKYTEKWLNTIKELKIWLAQELRKK
ncbi:MAG: HEPN domain-containing protein [Candidatus Uhrbacteria bacterium]|nr:HEPN domain-containing protein [Candidatus Uhrbacteria bacterium]